MRPSAPARIHISTGAATGATPNPQPLVFKGVRLEAGYSIAIGTGYNPSGYTFNSYLINASASGPRNAQREIEALAEYGPVAQ